MELTLKEHHKNPNERPIDVFAVEQPRPCHSFRAYIMLVISDGSLDEHLLYLHFQ
jgi:hypothetical protein